MKLLRMFFLLLLAGAVTYGGSLLWVQGRYAPSVDDVKQVVTASLQQQVPVDLIQIAAEYRVQDGYQGQVDSISVNKIGRKNSDESGREFWLVDVSVQGTCAVRLGGSKQGEALERNRQQFAGKVWYRMYPVAAGSQQLIEEQATWRAVLVQAAPFGSGRPRIY